MNGFARLDSLADFTAWGPSSGSARGECGVSGGNWTKVPYPSPLGRSKLDGQTWLKPRRGRTAFLERHENETDHESPAAFVDRRTGGRRVLARGVRPRPAGRVFRRPRPLSGGGGRLSHRLGHPAHPEYDRRLATARRLRGAGTARQHHALLRRRVLASLAAAPVQPELVPERARWHHPWRRSRFHLGRHRRDRRRQRDRAREHQLLLRRLSIRGLQERSVRDRPRARHRVSFDRGWDRRTRRA